MGSLPIPGSILGTNWVFGVCERSVLWTRDRKKGGVTKLIFYPPFFALGFLLFFFSFFWRFLSQYNSMEKVCVYKGRGLGIQWGKRGNEADMYARVGVRRQGAENEGQSVCGTGRRQDSAGGGVCEAH